MLHDVNVQSALKYVKESKDKIPVILIQDGGFDISFILDRASSDIREMFVGFDTPMMLKHRYHERIVFTRELVGKIQDICSRNESSIKSYLGFLSHFKGEAGGNARLMQIYLETRCKETEGKKPSLLKDARIFLDCDNLNDLRVIADDVKKSKVLVVILTKLYLTRPWCLYELHVAIESNIPIVPVLISDGGYDFKEGAKFLSTLTSETLDEKNKEASSVLQELGIDVSKLGKKLADVIPNVIALSFNPNGSKNQLNASADDIIDRILQLCS